MTGYETSASQVFEVASLPVLQDNSTWQVMNHWEASQRDFVILGGENEEVDRYSLTIESLAVDENRQRVHAALIAAADGLK
jgi:hypothetical protein